MSKTITLLSYFVNNIFIQDIPLLINLVYINI
nr:MAG TPA: hypothetical protein [Herelleviridae sp.]